MRIRSGFSAVMFVSVAAHKKTSILADTGMAQSLGFEPRVGYQPTHDFQSCALDHSANSASSVVCCGGSTATMIIISCKKNNVKGENHFFSNIFVIVMNNGGRVVDLTAKILYNRKEYAAKGGGMDGFV